VSGASARARWLGPLKLVCAFGLLAFVATRLPWRDRLEWRPLEGEAQVLSGSIEGDWRAASVRFEARASGAELERALEGWPAPERERVLAGAALERGPRAEGALEWSPSLPRVFRAMRPSGLAGALACFALALSCAMTRWWVLLGMAGCPTRWWDSVRLSFVGLFFNLVVPGVTGGDLVKAVAIAREHPGRGLAATLSIAVDRLLGLLLLLWIATAAVFLGGEHYAELRVPLAALSLGGALGLALYAHRPLRAWLRFESLLARLPLGARIAQLDRALLEYARAPARMALCALLSIGNHLGVIAGVWVLGRAFGTSELGLLDYFAIVPVANMVSAIPIAPGGWGVGEAAYHFLFTQAGASATLGVAVSASYRLCQMALQLLGGLFLLAPSARERAAIDAARSGASA
jgi:uncharacterized protein (TIRG00374 family)